MNGNIFWVALVVLGLAALGGGWWSSSLAGAAVFAAGAALVAALLYFYERKARDTAAKLSESDRYMEQLLGIFQDAVITYTPDFVISRFNPAAEHLFHLRAGAVVGRTITPQDAQDPALSRLAQTLFPSLAPVMIPESPTGADPEIVSLVFRDPELDIRVSASALYEKGNRARLFMKIIRDRTQELTMLKSKDEFVTIASHQLRTPLTEITWGLEALAADKNLSPESRQVAETSLTAIKGVVRMAENLLNIAKIEEGRFGYAFQEVDVEKLVDSVLEPIQPFVKQAGLSLYFERSATPLPRITGDPAKLSIALANLIENAMRYNVKGGEITVKIEKLPNEPFIQISVKDTGIGIPQDDQKRLFSKFFRAENAVKFQTRGSGLGLYILRNIVRAHGGNVQVHSEVGRGTTASFTLPTDPTLVPPKEVPMGM